MIIRKTYNGVGRRTLIRHALNDAIRDREGMVDAYGPNSKEQVVAEAQRDVDAYKEMLRVEYGTRSDADMIRGVAGKSVNVLSLIKSKPQKFKVPGIGDGK